jgi:hypothetical protein
MRLPVRGANSSTAATGCLSNGSQLPLRCWEEIQTNYQIKHAFFPSAEALEIFLFFSYSPLSSPESIH